MSKRKFKKKLKINSRQIVDRVSNPLKPKEFFNSNFLVSSEFLTLNESLLSSLYLTCPVTQRVVRQPVEDALRGGIEIMSEELGDRVKEVINHLEGDGIFEVVKYAFIWSRLYGGSVIFINSNDNESYEEFKLESVKKTSELKFYELSRHELEKVSPEDLKDDTQYDFYTLRGINTPVHKSRLIMIYNKKVPYSLRKIFKGWGYSEIERIKGALNYYNKSLNVLFELTDEAKLDIYKINGLKDDLDSPSGIEDTMNMINVNNYFKNYKNALVMDKDDDFLQKSINFSSISSISESARQAIVTASELNRAKILGEHSSSFSNDEASTEDYNALVESSVRVPMRKVLRRIISLLMKKLFGLVPEFEIKFSPLKIISSLDEEIIREKKTNRIISLLNSGVITSEDAKNILKRESLI